MAAPSVNYGFDTTLMPPAAAPSTQALGQPTVIGDSPQDADSTPIAPPAAPADTDSTPIAPPVASGDTDSTPIESPIPPLSDAELQAKMKRWGPMLSGDSMATPADLVEMQSSGKFTPGQLQRAQTESSLRQTYIQQQARTLGQKVGAGLSSGWDTVGNIAQDVTPGLRDYQTYQELAANPQADITENRGRVANSLLEGGYGAAAGVGSLAKGLITGSLHYLKNAVTGPRTAAQSEQDYQDWKKDYIATHAVPGYAPPAPSAVQNAESYYTGVAPENLPAPVAPLVSLASTAASIPAFGAAAKLGEAAIPKILAATGAEAIAPNLSKLLIPTTAAAKLKGAMSDALTKGAGEAAAPALDTTANKALPVTAATPEQAAAIQAANPSLLDRVNAAGKPISDKVDSAIAGIKALPGNLAEATAGAVSKAGEVAQAPAGVLDKLFSKLPSGDTPVSSYIRYKFLDHIPFFGQAVQAVKALEGAGKLTAGLGDFMERMATANPLDPMGRFAAAAEAAPAGHWMKAVVNNPAVKIALKVGTLAGDTAAATVKGAASGAALGVASNQSPEEIGQAAGGFAAFSGVHGAMSAGQAKILDAQIGGVAKVVTDHIAGGGSPDTLKLVPASDILTAANLKRVLPDYTVRFATDSDGTKPAIAKGQGGYYDRANKTLWVDPEKRAPGSTMLHEAFHPIFDEMVAQHPEIKSVLDQALAADTSAGPEGKTIDHFKLDYANRVSKGDPYAAADFIAGQDKANPDWGYSEMLCEAASHALDGKDLLQAMQGNDVQQSATQTALQGVEGWLSDNGVDLQQRQNTGTIFPDFKDSFNDPDLRRLTYRLLKAQRDSLFSRTPEEAPGTPLTSAAMGGAVAPTYNENGRQINQYGEVKDTPTGKKFVPFPASEIRRRMNAEKVALPKYFPEVGKNYTSMPAGLLADPDISPWTKNTLKTMFDAKDAQNKVSFWNQGLSGKKSAISDVAWARQVARDLGNVEARYQSGRFTGVKRSKANNLVMELDSEEAENQRLADWSQQHGPVSLDLWGGDQGAAKADIATYKKNLAANQPGETGIGTGKRDVINALLAGDNKEFQASNPLRSMLKKKDRAATFRSFRPERVGAITAEPTDVPAVKWERAKANLSPASGGGMEADDAQTDVSRAFSPSQEPAKREIMLTGPDGKQYPAKYDGLQEDFRGGPPMIQITPQVDLPGSTGKFSTTYEPSLLKQGYTLPADLKAEVDKYNAANPPKPMQFSASEEPERSYGAIERSSLETKREIELTGPGGKKYPATYIGTVGEKSPWVKISPNVDLPNGPTKGSITYAHRLEALGYKAPEGLSDFAKGGNESHPGTEWHAVKSLSDWTHDDTSSSPSTWIVRGSNNGNLAGYFSIEKGLTKPRLFKPGSEKVVYNLQANGKIRGTYSSLGDAKIAAKALYRTPTDRFGNPFPAAKPSAAKPSAAEPSAAEPSAAEPSAAESKINVGGKDYTRSELEKILAERDIQAASGSGVNPSDAVQNLRNFVERRSAPKKFLAELNLPPEKPGQFSPSQEPRAIKTAAVRDDKTGKIYEGVIHAEALLNYLNDKGGNTKTVMGEPEEFGVTSGFVTNNGKFLDREQAYKRAVELKQYKGEPTVAAYDDEAPSGLEARRFNQQQPMQFSVSQDPNAIASAAVQDEDTGKIYVGADHGAAAQKAPTGRASNLIDGYVTNSGKFLDRDTAFKQAVALKQYKPGPEDRNINQELYGLTSERFNKQNPNTYAGMQRAKAALEKKGNFSPSAVRVDKDNETLSYPMEMAPGKSSGKHPGFQATHYGVKLAYQRGMLKAMAPLFKAFNAAPGATTKSSYKNSTGEIEHNPATAVEVPADKARLFGLFHGFFTNQEAVAGGFQETSPGKWEPVGPHSFYVQPTGGETWEDKIKEAGPEAEALLAKLKPKILPAMAAVDKKWEKRLSAPTSK